MTRRRALPARARRGARGRDPSPGPGRIPAYRARSRTTFWLTIVPAPAARTK